jgi:hypothetical protein
MSEGAFRPRSWQAKMMFHGNEQQQKLFDMVLLLVNLNGIPIRRQQLDSGGRTVPPHMEAYFR